MLFSDAVGGGGVLQFALIKIELFAPGALADALIKLSAKLKDRCLMNMQHVCRFALMQKMR